MQAKLHLLGTGAPASDPHRTTTMVAFTTSRDAVLVDCGGDVLQRAMQAGIPVENIRAMVLTHEHPDHVGGWALFLEKIWLHGREEPIPVYGPPTALDQAERTFATYDTERWTGLPQVQWMQVSLEQRVEFLRVGPLRFTASPGTHGVPVIGVRVDNADTGGSVCYSSDTRPSEEITQLAAGSDILVHEASGDHPVHSSADQAAACARDAGVGRLVLVHLPPGLSDSDLATARDVFPSTELGEELAVYTF